MHLQYLKHKEIDLIKWDDALQQCSNKLIYAESIYLNTMCGKWDAIVNEDWTMIMPIPVKTKYGIKYSPNIPFIQQLGIFSNELITKEIMVAFVNIAKENLRLADLIFNYTNVFIENSNTHINYILPLHKSYDNLYKEFKNDVKKDLKKDYNLTLENNGDFSIALNLFQKEYQQRLIHVTATQYNLFKKLCAYYQSKNKLICKIVKNEKEEIVASAIFLKDVNRIYNLASTITANGKKVNANHFLFNHLIKEYQETNYILDFEGSDMEGIGNFYKQFGCINQPYYSYSFNNLPTFLKVLKK